MNTLLIDVRTEEEWNEDHIDGALLVPVQTLAGGQVPDVIRGKDLYLYCASGGRSALAAALIGNAAQSCTDLGSINEAREFIATHSEIFSKL